ncbi:MAG: hypothetical protein A3H70_02905 [Candidatus Komeilibacteria bacterium RIFCSPLOWO2_02_FULL_48_11]|uniref:VTT domain-containing protein n=1 Tax=Candidatus Komeilibacteria bacterium RIFCSPLOWO2_02_FULL_48_11 TaxID=1798553 RepID=A0A1G2BUR5_9BACT|nr:MAG: hypothetical protein A3H70_02905 [Candidatus Komeilibacteria bacterium RIFCSPLOWO2_02_FULL_48_11]
MALFLDIILHLDTYLGTIIAQFGNWTYLILGLIIFCETGLVVTPFFPGDSLLFTAGTLAAPGYLDPWLLFIVIALAAILGDAVNYQIGAYFGPKMFHSEKSRFFKREYLESTRRFYEKYGGKTIILARFLPVVRTFAPFVAGIGAMSYWRFAVYNIAGGALWSAIFVWGGYYFGNLEVVKNNFSIFIILIIAVSFLPGLAEYAKYKHRQRDV